MASSGFGLIFRVSNKFYEQSMHFNNFMLLLSARLILSHRRWVFPDVFTGESVQPQQSIALSSVESSLWTVSPNNVISEV
jgi:hypothetical protein